MTSLDPSATLVRALAPEPFDAFEVLMATLPGSARGASARAGPTTHSGAARR
ncbi:MAG: hypothetical protein V9E94_07755 [Microthrixaceae bacterium]